MDFLLLNLSHKKLYKLIILTNVMPKKEIPLKKIKKSTEKLLIENFIVLQRVLTNMSVKFESLSKEMSSMLNLFESSAKAFNEKLEKGEIGNENKELEDKLNIILDQNKKIENALKRIEKNAFKSSSAPTARSTEPKPRPKPLPRF